MIFLHLLAAAGFGPAVEFRAELIVIDGLGDGCDGLSG